MISINEISVQRYRVKSVQRYRVKDSLELWQLISEKRCDGYLHLQEDDCENEAPRAFLI